MKPSLTVDEAADLYDFELQFAADRESGSVRTLAAYLRLFGRSERVIASRYLEIITGADPAASAVESQIGPYRVVRELGRGGQGVVYLAKDPRLDRDVAVKVLSAARISGRDLARFRREAEIVAKLDHPNLCRVLDADIEGETPYIAMPFVDGISLADLLASARATTVTARTDDREASFRGLVRPNDAERIRATLSLFGKLASAIDAAHHSGVIHRDLKPGNIMLKPDGEPVILDFGLAREIDAVTATRTNDHFGTPAYMSPEQARGMQDLDAQTDVFSLGVTLYECLTGTRPFHAPTADQTYALIREHEPARPRSLNHSIPRDVEAVVMTAIAKEKRLRYQSAAAFAADLACARDGRPVLARLPSPPERLARWARRRPLQAAATVLVVVMAIVGTITLGPALDAWRRGKEDIRREQIDRWIEDGFAALDSSHPDRAERAFDKILSLDATHREAIAGRALAIADSGRPKDAVAFLASASASTLEDPVLTWLRDRLTVNVETAAPPPSSTSAFASFVAGELELSRSHADDDGAAHRAVGHFRNALMTTHRSRALYRFALARAARIANDADAARIVAAGFESDPPITTDGIFHFGLALSVIPDKAERALAVFEKVLGRDPNHRGAILETAALLRKVGRVDDARKFVLDRVAQHPDDAALLTLALEVHLERNDLRAAAIAARRLFEIDVLAVMRPLGRILRSTTGSDRLQLGISMAQALSADRRNENVASNRIARALNESRPVSPLQLNDIPAPQVGGWIDTLTATSTKDITYDESEPDWEDALRRYRTSRELRELVSIKDIEEIGRFFASIGRVANAVEAWEFAVNAGGTLPPNTMAQMAILAIARKKYERAVTSMNEAIRTGFRDARKIREFFDAERKAERYGDAVTVAATLVGHGAAETFGNVAQAMFLNLDHIAMDAKDADAVETRLRSDPRDFDAFARLVHYEARTHVASEDSAIDDTLLSAIRSDDRRTYCYATVLGRHGFATNAMRFLRACLDSQHGPRDLYYGGLSAQFLTTKDDAGGLKVIEAWVADCPESATAVHWLAQWCLYHKPRNDERAVWAAERAIDILSRGRQGDLTLASIGQLLVPALLGCGRMREAESTLRDRPEIFEEDPALRFDLLSDIAYRTGRFAEALEWLDKACAIDERRRDRTAERRASIMAALAAKESKDK